MSVYESSYAPFSHNAYVTDRHTDDRRTDSTLQHKRARYGRLQTGAWPLVVRYIRAVFNTAERIKGRGEETEEAGK